MYRTTSLFPPRLDHLLGSPHPTHSVFVRCLPFSCCIVTVVLFDSHGTFSFLSLWLYTFPHFCPTHSASSFTSTRQGLVLRLVLRLGRIRAPPQMHTKAKKRTNAIRNARYTLQQQRVFHETPPVSLEWKDSREYISLPLRNLFTNTLHVNARKDYRETSLPLQEEGLP